MGILDELFKETIFVSYDWDNDRHYKTLLKAWDANSQFSFAFHDQSVDVSVNSTAAGPIRRVISQRIKSANHFLCLVGEHTHRSAWVAREIDKTKELGKRLVPVKITKAYIAPLGLLSAGASWAMSFNMAAIEKAIRGW